MSSSSFQPAPSRRRPTRRLGPVVALALLSAACGGSPPDPPVVMLEPRAELAAAQDPARHGAAGDRGAAGPAAVEEAEGALAPAATADDVCDLVDVPEVMADPARWRDYLPALEALPLEDHVRDAVAGLDGDEDAVPTLIGVLDAVWDVVEDHCGVDAARRQCRSLLMYGMADPFGLGAAGGEPAEVEAAFDIAISNLEALREHSDDPALHHAVDAHVRVTVGARNAFESVGWSPDGLAAMEDLEADILVLGAPDVVEPLLAVETSCGFHQSQP